MCIRDSLLISDSDDFRKKLKLHYTYPKPIPPLLFFGNPLDIRDSLYAKAIGYNGAMTKAFIENTPKKVSMVNPALFSFELSVAEHKDLTIYNNDELNHIVYLISTGELEIEYRGKASFLQAYNGHSENKQLACLLVFRKVQKYFKNNNFCINSLNAIIECIDNTMTKARSVSDKIIALIRKSNYRLGTINDAINDGGCIFFQFDDYSKNRNVVSQLHKHSNYTLKFQRKSIQYYELTENIPLNTTLTVISRNAYLNLYKIAYISGVYLYSSAFLPKKQYSSKKISANEVPVFIEPPDDLLIDNVNNLVIKKVQSVFYKYAQLKYISKVHKIPKAVKYCFFVYYNKYLIGGFGFEWTKDKTYDVWLLSDFCTNNKIPRLSKLILLCVKSSIVKKILSRLMVADISSCYTKVYTSNPVSMKYRGLFNKVGRNGNHLIYDTQLGSINGYEEILEKYVKYVNSAK